MNEITLDYLSFNKIKPNKSLVGFVNFKIGQDYSYYQLPVHLLKNPKGSVLIRLLYPEKQPPPNRIMQEQIDQEVNAYLLANYKEALNGA